MLFFFIVTSAAVIILIGYFVGFKFMRDWDTMQYDSYLIEQTVKTQIDKINVVINNQLMNPSAIFKTQFAHTEINAALHLSRVTKSSTSFGCGKGEKVIAAGWEVTLCNRIWHVISRSSIVIFFTNCYI